MRNFQLHPRLHESGGSDVTAAAKALSMAFARVVKRRQLLGLIVHCIIITSSRRESNFFLKKVMSRSQLLLVSS